MAIMLVEVPTGAVTVDESKYPDRDTTLIFDHLVRYCSRFEPLPAIGIVLDGRTVTVVRGHKYLRVAKVLGRLTIRAVVVGAPTREELDGAITAAGGRVLGWEGIRDAEQNEPAPMGWHVFFFARALSAVEKASFERVVSSAFPGVAVRVDHDDAGPAAEFEAPTPVTDESWARRHLIAFSAFSQECVPIVSYLGRRFGCASGASRTRRTPHRRAPSRVGPPGPVHSRPRQ